MKIVLSFFLILSLASMIGMITAVVLGIGFNKISAATMIAIYMLCTPVFLVSVMFILCLGFFVVPR